MLGRSVNETAQIPGAVESNRYSFAAVYLRSWKLVFLVLGIMLLVFPPAGFLVAGKSGFYGTVAGLLISLNFQFLTLIFQSLSLRDLRRSMKTSLLGFSLKILFVVVALMLVYDFFPAVSKITVLVFLASGFISSMLQARLLSTSRMLILEPDSLQ